MTKTYVFVKDQFVASGERLSELLVQRGMAQGDLEEITGLDQGYISRVVNNKQKPGPLPCLYFAGLSKTDKDRDYWLTEAGLDSDSAELIAAALTRTPFTPKSKNRRWHDMLEEILTSGDDEAISAVQYNLRVFKRVSGKK